MKVLQPITKKYFKIIHLGDIHIRLLKRHDEYREMFDKFFSSILPLPNEETCIYIAGDVFHSKNDLQPEAIELCHRLLVGCANRFTTIVIAGQHDAILSNKSRLDSLSPIVEALNHPNLFYLKESGLYGLGNVLINNMSIFDAPEKYLRGSDIPAIYRNQYDHVIALFHGPVDGATLENGFKISNPAIMTLLFDGHDITLLGDVHLAQNMQDYDPANNKPLVRYVGSLIMQNHGESLTGHGYTLWDLSTNTYTHHELKNDYGYFTIEIYKGQLLTNLIDLPKKVRLRVKCFETITSEVKAIIAEIKSKADVVEISYVRMEQEDKKDLIPICKDIVLTDLANVEYQGKLITEFLEKKLGITDKTKIDDILKVNRETNLLIKKDEFARNLKWKPIRFEFGNMFTYSEGNIIDFTQMSGVYGIFGPNKSGKSSILSAMTFCLFDKFDRGFKGLFVRNVEKSGFKCKFEFEISGIRYFIERVGETTRSGNVKVNVRFWKIVNGVEEELHGTARRDTNEVIRDYIGTYEDFILTTLSVQTAKNNISFIDMGNTERKDLLVQFIGLNVFDRLYEVASEHNKELNTLIKLHKDKNYMFERNQFENVLVQAQSFFTEENTLVEGLRKQMADVSEQVVIETSNLIKLEDNVSTNLEITETRKTSAELAVRQKKQSIESYQIFLQTKENQIVEFDKQITDIEASNLVESHKTYKILTERINEVKEQINLKKAEVQRKLEKIKRLENYEYDPKCKYCINNADTLTKDAIKTQAELVEDKKETDKMISAWESLKIEFAKYQWVEQTYERYTKLLTDRSNIKDEFSSSTQKFIIAKNDLEKLDIALKHVTQQIELYHRNEVSVQHNEKINTNIAAYRNTLTRLDVEFQKHNRTLMDVNGKISLFKNKIQELTNIMEEVKKLEYEFDLYQNYIAAISRDGIPYQVICNTVPEIEKEINSILNQVVEYTIELETDGKNIVPYIVYDQRRWPIELSSAFERFVTSIAIRVALANISNLPKTTCLMIDEGFGTLDSDNLASMFTLFSFLKTNFDFIFVVSHIDALKDVVDHQIEIKHEGNFSKVIYE